jgi:tripartite-type tricarboxylate transporter receptor subunit TctC
MKRHAVTFSTALAAAYFGLFAPSERASAQDWPNRPVKVVIPFPAGGPTDVLGRPLVDHLSKVLGQPFLIDNRAGGGTTIGAQAVVKADPDGYTLFLGTVSPFVLAPIFNPNAGYTAKQLAHIVLVAESPMIMVASLKSGAKTVADVVASARKAPDTWSYASVGQTTTTHLLGEWFTQATGTKMVHVPYRGSAPAMTDLVGGQVQMFFDVASSSIPHVKAATITPLMMLHERRWSQLPNVPTSKEAGFPEFVGTFWVGLAAPVGTPPAIVDRLNREVNLFLKDRDFVKRLDDITYSPVGGPPEVLTKRIAEEAAIWTKVGQKAGIIK